jgi:nickel/cobalt transporter (NicO) family protein
MTPTNHKHLVKKLLGAAIALAALIVPAAAAAHPLGNFTTNHFTRIEVAGDRVYLTYVLDLAEIPTFQEQDNVHRLGEAGYARSVADQVRKELRLTVDRRRLPLHRLDDVIGFPPGAAGLHTTRLEVLYAAPRLAHRPARIAYSDGTFSGRLGWQEIVVKARDGATLTQTTAPSTSESDELRAYPKDLLSDPLHVTTASLAVDPGTSTGDPTPLSDDTLTGAVHVAGASETGFASLIARQHLGPGIVLLSLLIALFWGAAHALTPGHGKTIVAAYMVGSRGTVWHAMLLGLTVTFTHTIGVFALGLVTLALSSFIVPEQLYPWLNLASALLVVAVGAAVFRARIRARTHARVHEHAHEHHHHDRHGHDHHHAPPEGGGLRSLIAVGVSGGILPCPTALVVLLAAISLHRIGYGLALIVAFSLGLAVVVSGIALVAVTAKRTFGRMSLEGRVVRALPAMSAVVIVLVGLAMTLRALPGVVG